MLSVCPLGAGMWVSARELDSALDFGIFTERHFCAFHGHLTLPAEGSVTEIDGRWKPTPSMCSEAG